MAGQLHAGQLRYHEFAPLRDLYQRSTLLNTARPLRVSNHQHQYSNSVLYSTGPLHVHNDTFIRLPSSTGSSSSGVIRRPPQLQLQQQQQQRTFVSWFTKWMRLKPLEKKASDNPKDVHIQAAFLTELLEHYPEAVVERFESHANFVVTDHLAYLYLQAVKKCDLEFSPKRFVQRLNSGSFDLQMSQNMLREIEKVGTMQQDDGKYLHSNVQLATVMDILRTNLRGLHSGAAAGTALASSYGHHPKSPLYVAMSNTTTLRETLVKYTAYVLGMFLVLSTAGALLDERGMSKTLGIGGKHVQEAEGSNVRFDDVKGVDEAKAELEEIVLYLKDPDRFTRLGGKLPRGLLLTGPPGTGKTLLAKAIAGEAAVPFFFSSGSQFEEVYVGLGAKRVRDLFEAAKKKAPAIIFIDEIDAVGGSRKLKDQSALKMTLNELLVQMDGFDENNGIIVVGATNFVESLDSALLRPGRFDKHVSVPLPDVGGRRAILAMYAEKTKLSKDVNLDILARGTVGFSGADLYNLMNQAALKASVDGLNSITMEVFEFAKDKIMMGSERKTAVITAKTAKCTAFHEAGHAIVAVLTDGAQTIHKATIMPRGQSLGMVTLLPEGDQTSQSYKEMLASMDVAMAGRVSEELVFGKENITSGASSDIMSATRIARAMVTKLGFSTEVGIVYHGGGTGEESASGKTRASIDEEVKKLTDQAYERATNLLKKHKNTHYLLAETLLEYETLTGDEVRELIHNGKKPNRPIINTRGGAKGDQALFKEGGSRPSRSPLSGVGTEVGARRERQDS